MKYFTLEITYDDYTNETLNTITLNTENGTEFIECTDNLSTEMAIVELLNTGYSVRGYSC